MLRSPEFGNSFKLVSNTRVHRTLSGDLRTYQGSVPTWEGFQVTFTALTRQQAEAFKNYVIQMAAQEITFTDFENRTWSGIIVSPEIEFRQGIGECNFETDFEFEGNVTS